MRWMAVLLGLSVSLLAQPKPASKSEAPAPLVLRLVPDVAEWRRKEGTDCKVVAEFRSARDGAVSWLATSAGERFVVRTEADQKAPVVPPESSLQPFVLATLRAYPMDGTHPYHWPKSGNWKGCTRDLHYQGELLAAGDPQGRAYCCGLTFEVFLRAWMSWCDAEARERRILDFGRDEVRKLQSDWFGSAEERTCVRHALLSRGLGREISNWDEARAGDFVQLWRHDGSGHSVIFLAWERAGSKITGLRYWSTQNSTKGIGERVERFGDGKRDLKISEFYVVRAGVIPPNSTTR